MPRKKIVVEEPVIEENALTPGADAGGPAEPESPFVPESGDALPEAVFGAADTPQGEEPPPEDIPPEIPTEGPAFEGEEASLSGEPDGGSMPEAKESAAPEAETGEPPTSSDGSAEIVETGREESPGIIEESAPSAEGASAPQPEQLEESAPEARKAPAQPRAPSFFDLNYNKLDRDLSPEERQEWNSIYASYRSRSLLTGDIIGVDEHSFTVRDKDLGETERRTVQCAIVISYRVKVLIPETDMWFSSAEARPGFVLRNMVGAKIDYVILQVDREGGVAIGSRRMALGARRYQLTRLTSLHKPDALTQCRLLSVGPRRCLVECHGYDIGLTQREMRYTAIPDLRTEYHPGEELDCRIKQYDPEKSELRISVKEVHPHPFEGAELRHPVGSRRQAVIAGKYAGGVFCNLPDGTVCMSLYSARHDDADFKIGDKVIIVIRQYDNAKRQIYGKIVSKW